MPRIANDPDGTAWPAITFKSFKHGSASKYWKPRDLAWQIFACEGREDIGADTARVAEYAERARLAKMAAQARAVERDAADQLGRLAAADAAHIAWEAASPECSGHTYLVRKGVAAYGLRVATTTLRARLWDAERARWVNEAIVVRAGDLLVPVRLPDGQLINVQRIDRAGRKLFCAAARSALGCTGLRAPVAPGFVRVTPLVHRSTQLRAPRSHSLRRRQHAQLRQSGRRSCSGSRRQRHRPAHRRSHWVAVDHAADRGRRLQ